MHVRASSFGTSRGGSDGCFGATFPDPYVYKAAMYAGFTCGNTNAIRRAIDGSNGGDITSSLILDTRKVTNPLALYLFIQNTLENKIFHVTSMLASSVQFDKQMFTDCYNRGGLHAVMSKLNDIKKGSSQINTSNNGGSNGSLAFEEAQFALQTGLSPGPNDGTLRLSDPVCSTVGRWWWDTCRDRLAQWAGGYWYMHCQ